MRQRCEAIRSPVRCTLVVVACREPRQCLCQFFRERCSGFRAGESDVAFECDCREAFPLGLRARVERCHMAHRSRGTSHEIGSAKSIAGCVGGVPELSDGLRANDEGACCGADNPFHAVAVAALGDTLHEAFGLELPQVVAQPLTRRPELASQSRCRVRLRQMLEQLSAGAVQERSGLGSASQDPDSSGCRHGGGVMSRASGTHGEGSRQNNFVKDHRVMSATAQTRSRHRRRTAGFRLKGPIRRIAPHGQSRVSVTGASSAEVVVIGAGPAGASAARLLSSLGHRVTVLTRPAARPALAESIPPSATKLLAHLGWDALVDRAGFIRSTGNTVLWGAGGAQDGIRETYYADSGEGGGGGAGGGQLGYQVDRGVLNELLLDDVRRAQCRVMDDVTVTGVRDGIVAYGDAAGEQTMRADWVLDCSGRGAVVGRAGWRQAIPLQRTLAIAGLWERIDAWPLPDATHTIVESHADGWAWSVPLSMTRRHVTVMIDPGLTKVGAHPDLRDAYASELSRVPGLSSLTRDATLLGEPFARDASAYRSRRVCGPGLLLVGDAASFVDPLSSFGIKKALASAWLAAIVVHTCLIDAAMTDPALALFEGREAAMFDALDRARIELARSALDHGAASTFWAARALPGAGEGPLPNEDIDGALLREDPDVRAAFDELRRRESITFAASATLEWVQQPTVQDNRVVLESRLSLPAYPRGIRYVRSVDLAKVVHFAPKVTQVPDLYELYCRSVAPVPLADFLGVLSFLVAKRVLVFA